MLSGFSFAANITLTAVLHELIGVGEEVSFAVALATVFAFNFALMRWFVFAGAGRPLLPQFLGFGLSSLAFRGLEFCTFLVLHQVAGIPYLLAATATLTFSFVAKYLFYGRWLFARGTSRGPR